MAALMTSDPPRAMPASMMKSGLIDQDQFLDHDDVVGILDDRKAKGLEMVRVFELHCLDKPVEALPCKFGIRTLGRNFALEGPVHRHF
jgi:hypothetical protein